MDNSEIISHLIKYKDKLINEKIEKGLVPPWSAHRTLAINFFIGYPSKQYYSLEKRKQHLKNLINAQFPDPNEPDEDNPAKRYAGCLDVLDNKEF